MNICKSYEERETRPHLLEPLGFTVTRIEGICLGTKECDPCSCGGDPAKCNFYPEKRAAAKKNNKEEIHDRTTIYYAHHQWKYGTKVEEYEVELIKRYFPHASIFNPSADLKTNSIDEEEIMDECLERVRNSDILVFSSMNGCVGTGVYHEVEEAQKEGKLVLYIFQDTLTTGWILAAREPFERTDRLYATVSTRTVMDL